MVLSCLYDLNVMNGGIEGDESVGSSDVVRSKFSRPTTKPAVTSLSQKPVDRARQTLL